MQVLLKVLILVSAILIGTVGLLMTLCGGYFTIGSLLDMNLRGLPLPLGSIIIGITLTWAANRLGFGRWLKPSATDSTIAPTSARDDESKMHNTPKPK
jgi:hypothetical protein